ncbi:hypothetical protein JCM10213_000625 [Rhodosporidiobolus nylandii]
MPSDLRSAPSTRRRSPKPAPPHFTPLRVFLICFFGALYALAALRWDLPPHNWMQRWVYGQGQEAKVVQQRPALRGVERYDQKHRYRPAASPIITSVGKDGKVAEKGRYY